MAKATKKAKADGKFPGLQETKLLWKKIDPQQWYALLRRLAPDGKWQLSGRTIKGCCPYHHDKTPSFILNFDRAIGKCFGSCGKTVTDLVQLIAKITNDTYAGALTFLNGEFELTKILDGNANELAAYHANQEMKKLALVAMREVASEYLRDKPKHLEYMLPALTYLTKGRGIPLGLIDRLPVVIYPKPEHVKKYLPEMYHKLYVDYMKQVDSPRWYGSLLFAYNDAPGSISRFKLRHMSPDAETVLNKYTADDPIPHNIARDLCTKEFVFLKDAYTEMLGVFGLHHYSRMVCNADTNAYITEGEFDALAAMVAQIQEDRRDFVIFAAGGKSGTELSFLREYGIRCLWVVQDSPAKRGDDFAKAILRSKHNFLGDSINKALTYKVFQWPTTVRGGDLDDAVHLTGYDTLCRYLCAERDTYFLNSFKWAVKMCGDEIAAIKSGYQNKRLLAEAGSEAEANVIISNIEDDQRRDVRAAILEWLGCVHDQIDKVEYTRHFSEKEGIDVTELSEVSTNVYALDTMEGCMARLRADMKKNIELAYYEMKGAGNQFTLWSKTQCVTAAMPMNDKGLEQVLSQYIGKDVLSWAKGLLGSSPVLLEKTSGSEIKDNTQMLKNVLFMLQRIFMEEIGNTRHVGSLSTLGQGIHFKYVPQAEAGNFCYFVNGTKAFRGKFNNSSGLPIEWEFLNSVVDGDILFLLHPSKRWSVIDDVQDLYAGSGVDLKATFEKILKVLDGWKFEHHSLMREYLAAWIMSIPIQKAVGQVNITFFTGESTSGKTSFVKGLLGGYENAGHGVPPILEAARCATDATPAWIYQEMNGTSLLLGLDEAESGQDTDHGDRVHEIQNMMYSIPTGGATTMRGGISADQRVSYFLRMPVIMSGINMNSDPVFLTRVMVVYTKKDPTRRDVGDYIADNFSEREIVQLRKDITTGLLSRIPEIIERKDRLYQTLLTTPTATTVTSRFITSVLTVLTVYEMVGGDPVRMFQDIIEKNRSRLEALHGHDFQSDLLNAVLYTESVAASVEDGVTGKVSPRKLIMESDFVLLNNSSCGVYFIPAKGWIVIVWRLAKYVILDRHGFRGVDEASMVEAVSKNSYVITEISLADHEYIRSFRGITDIKSASGYTVVDSKYLMDEETQDLIMRRAEREGSKRKPVQAGVNDGPEIPIEAYENDTFANDFGDFSL